MKFRVLLIAALALSLLGLPVLAQDDLTLVTFTDNAFGISGMIPEGWTNIAPGVHARQSGLVDPTLIAQQAAPVSGAQLWASLLPQLGLQEVPESTATLETEALTWALYRVDVPTSGMTVVVDVAIAELDGTGYVVLLQTVETDYEGLHEQVFLPVLNAFTPVTIQATPETEAEATVPPPYLEEEVTFQNNDVTLAGTLTLPPTPGPHPAVVLITGSGAQDRDESLEPFAQIKPFRLIADYLTRSGIAVLRYDDRGVGESTGDFASAVLPDFASDAEAAVIYLRTRDDIQSDQIGILGHSEGGSIAPEVANNTDAAFIITLSGTAVSGEDALAEQNRRIYQTLGYDEATIEDLVARLQGLFTAVIAGDEAAIDEALYETALAQIKALPEADLARISDPETYARSIVDEQGATYAGPWWPILLTYNPADHWQAVTAPVLALFGTLDVQVDADQNVSALEDVLEAAGHSDYTIEVFPTANHLFQDAVTGGVEEYAALEQIFIPDLLPTITEWLLARVDVSE